MSELNEILKNYWVPIAVISEMEKCCPDVQSKILFLEHCINDGIIVSRESRES